MAYQMYEHTRSFCNRPFLCLRCRQYHLHTHTHNVTRKLKSPPDAPCLRELILLITKAAKYIRCRIEKPGSNKINHSPGWPTTTKKEHPYLNSGLV